MSAHDDTREGTSNSSEQTLSQAGGNKAEENVDMEGQEKRSGSQKPIGFWHKDLAKTRRVVAVKWWTTTAILCAFILGVLSIYWGSLFKAYPNAHRLVVYIVNFDTAPDALVGPVVSNVFVKFREQNPEATLGFVEMSPSLFNNEPLTVRESVYYEDAYAAVIINANASTLLRQAVETGNSSYEPLGACQLIYNEARDQDAYYDFIYPIMNPLVTQATSMVGQRWASMVVSNSTLNNPTNLAQAPQALAPAIGFSIFNLRPFYPPVAIPAVSVGLIYLIIISFFSFGFYMPTHMLFVKSKDHRPLKPLQWIFWRWASCVAAYFFMSLAYSLVSLAFQIPFSNPPSAADVVATNTNAYGKATFFVYWMINFWGMFALGMACENMAMIVGLPWTSMWLIFWVITNVATAFDPLDIQPMFYYWGYAWPLHNVVEASRTLIFDTRSKIGLNFGILIAWAAVNTLLYPFASFFMKWKEERAAKKSQ